MKPLFTFLLLMLSVIVGALCWFVYTKFYEKDEKEQAVAVVALPNSTPRCIALFELYLESVQMKTLQSDLKGQVDPAGVRGAWYATYSKQENNFKYSGDIYDNSLVLSYFIANGRHRQAWELAHTFFNIMCFSEKYDPNACTYEERVKDYRGLKPRYNALPDGKVAPGSEAWVQLDLGNNSYMTISLYKFGFAYNELLKRVYGRNMFMLASYDLTRNFMEVCACNPKNTEFTTGNPDGTPHTWVLPNLNNEESVGYAARPYVNPYMSYVSNEHMIDMFALANIQVQNFKTEYYASLGVEACTERMDESRSAKEMFEECLRVSKRYVRHMFGKESYGIGSGLCYRADTWRGDGNPDGSWYVDGFVIRSDEFAPDDAWKNPTPVDTQTWNMLADCEDDKDRKEKSLDWAIRYSFVRDTYDGLRGCYESSKDLQAHQRMPDNATLSCDDVPEKDILYGFRFTKDGHGIQWENAGSGVMALMKAELKHKFDKYHDYIEKIIKSIRRHFELRSEHGTDPLGLYASFRTASEYDGIGDPSYRNTGLTWGYYRAGHLGGTTYPALSLLYYEHYKKRDYAGAEVYNPYSSKLNRYPDIELRDLYPTETLPDRSLDEIFKHPVVDGERKLCKIDNRQIYTVHDVWREEEHGMMMPTFDAPGGTACAPGDGLVGQWSIYKEFPDMQAAFLDVAVSWTEGSRDLNAEISFHGSNNNWFGVNLYELSFTPPGGPTQNHDPIKLVAGFANGFKYGSWYDNDIYGFTAPTSLEPGTYEFRLAVSGWFTDWATTWVDELPVHTVIVGENGLYTLNLQMTFHDNDDGSLTSFSSVADTNTCATTTHGDAVCYQPPSYYWKWSGVNDSGGQCTDENFDCPAFHNKVYWMCGYPDSWWSTYMVDKEQLYIRCAFPRDGETIETYFNKIVDGKRKIDGEMRRRITNDGVYTYVTRANGGVPVEGLRFGQSTLGGEFVDEVSEAVSIGVHQSDDAAEDDAARLRSDMGAPSLDVPRNMFVVTIMVTVPMESAGVVRQGLEAIVNQTFASVYLRNFDQEFKKWPGTDDTIVIPEGSIVHKTGGPPHGPNYAWLHVKYTKHGTDVEGYIPNKYLQTRDFQNGGGQEVVVSEDDRTATDVLIKDRSGSLCEVENNRPSHWLGGDKKVRAKSDYWKNFFGTMSYVDWQGNYIVKNTPSGFGEAHGGNALGQICGIPLMGNCHPHVAQGLISRFQSEYLGGCINEKAD